MGVFPHQNGLSGVPLGVSTLHLESTIVRDWIKQELSRRGHAVCPP